MRMLLVFLSAIFASFLGATETVPFYVGKVSGSGAYSSKQFKTLWDAFRQEYSVSSKGTFSPYYYTEYVIEKVADTSAGKTKEGSFFQLFYDPERKENFQHLTGNQETWKEMNKYVSMQLAMDGARRFGARMNSMTIGAETSVSGVYACSMASDSVQDVDAREASSMTSVSGSATSITFCDPKNPRTGRATMYIESHSHGSDMGRVSASRIYSSSLREVGTILDTKENQDSFVTALKAGSSFRVFWFKEITCTNCGGLGRLSTLAVNQAGGSRSISGKGSSSNPFGSRNVSNSSAALSLTPGTSAAADRCPACAGSGKRMRGYLSTLMWEDKGPSFDPAR